MLAPLCQYVILGHSERRSLFKEDDSIINRKVHTALAAGLKVILCVGETLEDRQQGRTSDLVISQLMAGLDAVSNLEDIVIAYEPVWAIGTGQAASGHQANHVVTTLRSLIRSAYSPEAAEGVRILYGGSVTASNASEYLDQPDIDGALVGGASLKVEEFTSIAKKATPGLAI
jgi:triosephosphate isomerase